MRRTLFAVLLVGVTASALAQAPKAAPGFTVDASAADSDAVSTGLVNPMGLRFALDPMQDKCPFGNLNTKTGLCVAQMRFYNAPNLACTGPKKNADGSMEFDCTYSPPPPLKQ